MVDNISYSWVFQAMPTPCVLVRPNAPVFTIIDANAAYLGFTKMMAEDLLGKGFFEAFPLNPQQGNTEWTHIFDRVLLSRSPDTSTVEKYHLTPITGDPSVEIKWVQATNTPILSADGNVIQIVRTLSDMSEATIYKEFLNKAQKVADVGNWEINMQYRTTNWSPALKKILETNEDFQPDLKSFMHFIDGPAAQKRFAKDLQKATKEGGSFRNTIPIVTAQGNKRWLSTIGKADLVNDICVRIYGISQDITGQVSMREALISNERHFHNLVQTLDGVVWETDVETLKAKFISDKIEQLLGYTSEEWLSEPMFWQRHVHEADKDWVTKQAEKLVSGTYEYRMTKKDGSIAWIKDIISVVEEYGKPRWLRGIMLDITERKYLAEIDKLEKRVLEQNAIPDYPIMDILSEYLSGIEILYPGLCCSLHRVQRGKLLKWVAPSLPETYLDAIHLQPIGTHSGSCGTAAYLKKPIYINDISKAPEWARFKHLPLSIGLKACWSYPIIDTIGEVIAVFGIYYKQARGPDEHERNVIERACTLLQIVLENRTKSDLLRKANDLIKQTQELARFGNWQWDMETNQVLWSDILYDIYGVHSKGFQPSFENYLAAVHEEDRERVSVTLKRIQQTGKDAVFEERIVRPDGEIRHLKSWARFISHEDDIAVGKMIGACLDVTGVKAAETELKYLYAQMELHLRQVADSEEKYSNLFHMSPLPIWLCDGSSHTFLDVNAAAIDQYGYSHEEFLSMTTEDIASPDRFSGFEDNNLQPGFHVELFSKDIFLHRKKNGDVIYVRILTNTIEINGSIADIIIVQDITEKLSYIRGFEIQNKKLQEIAWMQSHLVRAPLARIMALADLLRHAPETASEMDELLAAIDLSAAELDTILRDITDKAERINLP